MTTVILTIIGILLAAAAALMIVYYGSDGYERGATNAQASTLVNAAQNVMSAEQMFFNRDGKGSADLTELQTEKFLSDLPEITDGQVQETYADLTNSEGDTRRAFVVTNVTEEVCLSVEQRINQSNLSTVPTSPERQIGCYNNGTENIFYAKLV